MNENGKYGRKMCLSTQRKRAMKINNEVEELVGRIMKMIKMMTVMKKPPGDRLVVVLIVNTNTNSEQIQRRIQIQRNHLRSGRLLF